MAEPEFRAALERALIAHMDGVTGIGPLTRLSGGASQETWSFDAQTSTGRELPLILRRAPGGSREGGSTTAVSLETEAQAIGVAASVGVPAPEVPYVLRADDGAGQGYVMARLEGETLARKVLRDAAFDAIRPKLARQCGEVLARLHKADPTPIEKLNRIDGPTQLRQCYERYSAYDQPKPVFELAFKYLQDRLKDPRQVVLVHGDFRHGNLMIHPERGIEGVLDWEITHLGDPLEDLSWVCVNSWRFGVSGKTVGGFGTVEDMLAGYRDAGGAPYTAEDVKIWEVFGTLKWGIMCMSMYEAFRTGFDRSVERAAIGRRSSETEIDLVNLLIG